MPGIPFRSVLSPHMDFIRARRRAGATWREIADALTKRGVTASVSNVSEVFRRAQSRKKWPAGLEPMAQASTPSAEPDESQEAEEGPRFSGGRRRPKAAVVTAQNGPPRPFRSRLAPHMDFIRQQRKGGAGWRQIAEDLAKRGVRVSFQGVADYYARTDARALRLIAETQPPTFPQEDARTPVAPLSHPTPQKPGKARPGEAEGSFAGLD